MTLIARRHPSSFVVAFVVVMHTLASPIKYIDHRQQLRAAQSLYFVDTTARELKAELLPFNGQPTTYRTAGKGHIVAERSATNKSTIIISDDGVASPSRPLAEFCDRVGARHAHELSKVPEFPLDELSCVRTALCPAISRLSASQVRKLACGLEHLESGVVDIKICCSVTTGVLTSKEGGDIVVEVSGAASQATVVEESGGETEEVLGAPQNMWPTAAPSTSVDVGVILTRHEVSQKFDKLPRQCGVGAVPPQASTETRIIGGSEAQKNAWPSMALLMKRRRGAAGRRNAGGLRGRFEAHCGGTLITSRVVLTAAHCVTQTGRKSALDAWMLMVRLGVHNMSAYADEKDGEAGAEVAALVSRVTVHPQFNAKTLRNDIALLQLAEEVPMSEAVQPACLPHESALLRAGADVDNKAAWIIGFGRTIYNGASSDILMQAELSIVPHDECKEAFAQLVRISDESVCAAAAGADSAGKDACQGDSGGPLLVRGPRDSQDEVGAIDERWFVYGVVSFGYRCNAGFPGVYTRVNKYLSWIAESV